MVGTILSSYTINVTYTVLVLITFSQVGKCLQIQQQHSRRIASGVLSSVCNDTHCIWLLSFYSSLILLYLFSIIKAIFKKRKRGGGKIKSRASSSCDKLPPHARLSVNFWPYKAPASAAENLGYAFLPDYLPRSSSKQPPAPTTSSKRRLQHPVLGISADFQLVMLEASGKMSDCSIYFLIC